MAEPTSRSAHILVVDDDPRIRQMLIRYFEEEGYHVSAVADGRGVHGGEKTIQWSACVCAGAGGVKVGHWIG